MRIYIDPNEMGPASEVLQQCALELADVGSQLASCVDCPMPPAVSADVNAIISTVDVVLDRAGEALTNEAIGLVARGILAALDSLAAASGVTLSALGVIGGNTGAGLTITSAGGSPAAAVLAGAGVIGGNTTSGFTILNSDGSPASSLLPGVSVIGGGPSAGITITNSDGSPATLLESGVIGGTNPLGLTITPGAGSAATGLGSSLGEIGGHPSPYPAFTFSPGPSSGAGSVDLRGISFDGPIPYMPAPSGFVPAGGDIGQQMGRNIGISAFTQGNLDAIRYSTYAYGQTSMGNTPVDREDYTG